MRSLRPGRPSLPLQVGSQWMENGCQQPQTTCFHRQAQNRHKPLSGNSTCLGSDSSGSGRGSTRIGWAWVTCLPGGGGAGKGGILLELRDWGWSAQRNGMLPGKKSNRFVMWGLLNVWMKVFLCTRKPRSPTESSLQMDLSVHWRSWAWLFASHRSPLCFLSSWQPPAFSHLLCLNGDLRSWGRLCHILSRMGELPPLAEREFPP